MNTPGFVFSVVDSADPQEALILEEIYRLRYQVYVNEWGFERPEDHPTGLERDEFDAHSKHFYVYGSGRQQVVGTARIILDAGKPFPIEKHFAIDTACATISREKIAEISRLAISKDYRRRAIDRVIFSKDSSLVGESDEPRSDRRILDSERRKCEHELICGLYLLIYRESLRLGLTHWYAVMAKGLYVILCRWGVVFRQIGEERDYHGVRAPYLLSIADLTRNLVNNNPELLKMASEG